MFRPLTGRSFDSTVKLAPSLGLALACLTLTACATAPSVPAVHAQGCTAGERPAQVVQLFFGRNVGAAPGVSEKDWESFLDQEIVPRFPDGLSVIDTAGVWRGKDGSAVHELGKAVVIVLTGRPEEQSGISAVTRAYKTRFSQDSVLTARSRSCVAF